MSKKTFAQWAANQKRTFKVKLFVTKEFIIEDCDDPAEAERQAKFRASDPKVHYGFGSWRTQDIEDMGV